MMENGDCAVELAYDLGLWHRGPAAARMQGFLLQTCGCTLGPLATPVYYPPNAHTDSGSQNPSNDCHQLGKLPTADPAYHVILPWRLQHGKISFADAAPQEWLHCC